ncbi:MAG TPA: hypothetical protein ENI27_05420 [bacterium]|nr:hypothetical protein [bacterium]
MTDQNNVDSGDTGEKNQAHNNVNTDENREHMIPKSRFDALNEKRKAAESALEEIATGLIETIPEEMRDIIPDLPPAEKVKWIQAAEKKGLFSIKQETNGPDSKKPGDKKPTDFENMSPQAIMATGYKTK